MNSYHYLVEWHYVHTDMLEGPKVLTVPDDYDYGLQAVACNIAPKLFLKALKAGIDLVSL